MKNLSKGATTVILTLLIIGVAAVGAWVAYDILSKKNDDVTTTTDQTQADSTVSLAEACAATEKICIKYPNDWKVTNKSDDDTTTGVKSDTVSVTSPDDKYTVRLTTGVSGVGGTCIQADHGQATAVGKKKTALTGYAVENGKVADAYAVSAIASNAAGDKFSPWIMLTNRESVINASGESSFCGVYYLTGLVDAKNVQASLISLGLGDGVSAPDGTSDSLSFDSKEKATDYLNTEEGKQALDIVASAYYK